MQFTADTFKQRIAEKLPAPAPGNGPASDPNPPQRVLEGPQIIDVSPLSLIGDDERFLQEAYRRILGRECDLYGFMHHLEMLRNHVPRQVIVHSLVNSEEAKQSGRQFTGLRNLRDVAGNLGYRARAVVRSAYRGMLERARGLVRILLQVGRFELLEQRLDSVLLELRARTDQLSGKTDQAFWGVSEKLDAYVQDIHRRQNELSTELYTALCTDLGTLIKSEGARAADLAELLAAQQTRIREATELLSVKIDAYTADLHGRQAELIAKQTQVQALLKAYEEGMSARLAGIESRLKPPVVRGGDNVLATEVDGFIVGFPGEEWRLAAYHTFRGVLEPGLTRLFQNTVKPGMVVVDVGANIGMYTLYAARLTGALGPAADGKVYSFEPTPRTFAILKDNIQVNGFLESGVVDLRQLAVCDKKGVAEFTIYRDNSGHNTMFAEDTPGERVLVETISLDEALESAARVDVVKIDAEGAEPFILRGMTRIIVQNPAIQIFMEFAPQHLRRAGIDPASFLDEIVAMGLTRTRVDDVTGELLPVTNEELLASFSANLYLRRSDEPSGAAAG